ncbi:response regulator transcription factor [Paenibacillus radicis (ex Xue et al. 2023)]|uniref:Response regulator transcription factor n=1 Tax=Paenibacillus radicis (ex Xue et al. 2023) TaxID=2972489 RepID=A0ABT1Y9C1_9BACL|nr:response regulator transcription factor [Paenibacillus radicis (ex Xue et al. 2023)]MCR8629776.1 response regulator transcription factor [Paenibacillus radicis (ex Xue et al. 2023)]
MKVLLAEDDIRLGELTVHMLKKKAGCTVDWVTTGNDAFDYAMASSYDVVVLDWMMPDGNGRDTCAKLRRTGYLGAILMLTAKDALQDRVEGLDAGADDYLVKPFEMDELLARLRALMRRNFVPLQEDVIRIRDLELQRTNQIVIQGAQEIQLSPREFQILDLLLQNKGRTLTREVILDKIWGLDAEVNLKSIDAIVKLIRKKLDNSDSRELIQSVRGVGYKIEA